MGRSSRRWGAGWARISRQSLHKSLLIARSQNGPIRSLDISKFRTRPHPYPSLSNRSADRLESSSNFVPSDGLIFMQTFALTLFKHPPRPEPSAHAKFVYAQARKRRFSRLTVYKIRTLHPPPKKPLPYSNSTGPKMRTSSVSRRSWMPWRMFMSMAPSLRKRLSTPRW